MSHENVEIVRRTNEAWNAGDMDAVREQLDPGVILRHPEDWPEPGPFLGPEAVVRQFEQQRDTWDSDALGPISEFIHAADRVGGSSDVPGQRYTFGVVKAAQARGD